MILRSQRALIGEEWVACDIRIEGQHIAEIAPELSVCGEQILELGELTVLPGLIDSHIHGYAGQDSMDADEAALQAMSKALLEAGVTAFLPTTMTAQPDDICNALSVIGGLAKGKTEGAKILGAFAEGPFITAEHRGAQPLEAIAQPNEQVLERMVEASGHTLKKIIVAPEVSGAADFCESLRSRNIIPALGHSSATYAETRACIDKGAAIAVHTYNGMRGLHHREPGLLGAVMTSDELYAELIFDTIHVHPQAAELLVKAKGTDKIVLISDCMRAGGMADGDYMLGDTRCFVREGIARTAEGNLAGSTLKLIDAVKNMVTLLHIPLAEAVKMASANPAKSLGLFDQLGSIAPGKAADLIAIDEDFNVKFAMVDGTIK